jgi:hypothetical protein
MFSVMPAHARRSSSFPFQPLQFDDYWILDATRTGQRICERIREKTSCHPLRGAFLAVWRIHFNRWKMPQEVALMYGLDSDNWRKMIWLLAMLRDFDLR